MGWNECGEVDKIKSGKIKIVNVKKIRRKEREKCQFVTPFFPPNRDLEALELATDVETSMDFIKDFLRQFIRCYYSPLAPFTAPLED